MIRNLSIAIGSNSHVTHLTWNRWAIGDPPWRMIERKSTQQKAYLMSESGSQIQEQMLKVQAKTTTKEIKNQNMSTWLHGIDYRIGVGRSVKTSKESVQQNGVAPAAVVRQ